MPFTGEGLLRGENPAYLRGEGTTGVESTAFGEPRGIGHNAVDWLQPIDAMIDSREGLEKAFRIRVPGIAIDLADVSVFHDLASIHNSDFVTDFRHDPEIVGNEEHRGA